MIDWTKKITVADKQAKAQQESQQRFESAVQSHMDAQAKALGYDHIASAVTYAEEMAVPKFRKEGRAFRAWRSQVWAYAYEQLDAVLAGEREQPTIDEFIAELPALNL